MVAPELLADRSGWALSKGTPPPLTSPVFAGSNPGTHEGERNTHVGGMSRTRSSASAAKKEVSKGNGRRSKKSVCVRLERDNSTFHPRLVSNELLVAQRLFPRIERANTYTVPVATCHANTGHLSVVPRIAVALGDSFGDFLGFE